MACSFSLVDWVAGGAVMGGLGGALGLGFLGFVAVLVMFQPPMMFI